MRLRLSIYKMNVDSPGRVLELLAGFGLSVIACVVLAGCTKGSGSEAPARSPVAGNRPPVVTAAKIVPNTMSQNDRISLEIQAEDPDHQAVNYLFQWYADDALLPGQTDAILTGEMLRRGQKVSAEVTPTDGELKGQPFRTTSIVVGNTPPRVSAVSLAPQAAKPGQRLEAVAEASDPDHDRVDMTYRWLRNGEVVKDGDEAFLDTPGFLPGDHILVEVATRDLSAIGNTMRSEALVLGNGLPTITSIPPTGSASGDRFEYVVKAVDPDGDQLVYRLDMAPPGMTISETLGRIDWQIPSDKPGSYHVKVVVHDGRGGSALQEFDLTLTATGPAKPTKA